MKILVACEESQAVTKEFIEHEHPYHIPGRPETYSEYNDGWTDAIDRVRAELSKINRIHYE